MPFPPGSTATRSAVIRQRRREEYLKRQLELAELAEKERYEYAVRELLKERIPEVQEDIAWELWGIVAALTTDLLAQFENGDAELRTVGYYRLELFYGHNRNNRYTQIPTENLGYVDVLARMGALYNASHLGCNIGQSFELERSMRPIPPRASRRRGYDGTVYAKITATAPLPADEAVES